MQAMRNWHLAVGLVLAAGCNDSVEDDEPMGFGDGGAAEAGTADGDAEDGGDDDGDEDGGRSADGGTSGDAGASDDAGSDAGTQEDGGDRDGGGKPSPQGCIERPEFGGAKDYPTFAVHNSDYSAASVALLDEDGDVLDDSYISSSSMVTGLAGGLHGDIALPSTPAEPNVLTVVARAMGDYILRIDLGSGEVINQIRTQSTPFEMDEPSAAYASNPYDYLYVNEKTAFVPRFAPNLDGSVDPLEKGDDLLIINPKTGERIDRIALDAWVTTIEVDNGSGVEEETVYARPSSIVGLGCHAVVGTARLSMNWNGTDGAIAVLDLVDESVEKVDLDVLRNCGEVVPVSGDDSRVIVQCAGSPFGNPASAGLALVHVDEDGEASVEETYLQEGDDAPVLSASAVSLGGTRLVVKQSGDYTAGTGDVLYELDIESGEYSKIYTADGPGSIGGGSGGGGAYDPVRDVLYVPDAAAGVRVFEVSDDGLEEQDVIVVDPVLPARNIVPLRPLQ